MTRIRRRHTYNCLLRKYGKKTLANNMHFYFQKAAGKDTSENAAGFVNLFLIALATFSTAYNVVLYIIFNPSFRRAITEILKCRQNISNLEVNRTNNDETHLSPESPPVKGGGDLTLNDRIFTVASTNI